MRGLAKNPPDGGHEPYLNVREAGKSSQKQRQVCRRKPIKGQAFQPKAEDQLNAANHYGRFMDCLSRNPKEGIDLSDRVRAKALN